MPRAAAISAYDVISFMLFDNEGAGNVSDDELPDQIEINSEDDDEISNLMISQFLQTLKR